MREWLAAQLAEGFPAFAGSRLSGTVSVKQELVNELIATWLAAPATARPTVDVSRARAAIRSASIRAEPGRVLVDFEIAL